MSCYHVFGLRPGTPLAEVRRSYRELVRRWHPDLYMHDEALRRAAEREIKFINYAYATLERFLSFRVPFRIIDPRPARPSPPSGNQRTGRGRRQRTAAGRFRERSCEWLRRIRFSFEDPDFFECSALDQLKHMWLGVVVWVGLIGLSAARELPQVQLWLSQSWVATVFSWAPYAVALVAAMGPGLSRER